MPDGLQKAGVDALTARQRMLFPVPDRRQHDVDNVAQHGVGLDRRRERSAIDAGHLIVGDDHLIRIAGIVSGTQRIECLFAGRIAAVAHTPARDLLVNHAAVHGVVIDDEDAKAAQTPRPGLASRSPRRCRAGEIVNQNVRSVALERSSTRIDPPISSTRLLRDRQSEPGAAVAARRRAVGLRELLEERC